MSKAERVQGTKSPLSQIFQFPDQTFVENLHVIPDGRILLTTMSSNFSGNLLVLDPEADPAPTVKKVVALPGSTGLTGIATLSDGLYAVTGGLHSPFKFERGSMSVYIVSFKTGDEAGVLVDTIPIPETMMMNGMAPIPADPHVLLSADSIDGRIIRIDTRKREFTIAFSDPALSPSDNGVPLGINGLKIVNDYMYFTNSAKGMFSRVRIDHQGNRVGCFETLATLQNVTMAGNVYDDFAIDSQGSAYVSIHPLSVNQIDKDGIQTLLVGGGNSNQVRDPTAVVMANDERSIYIATGGGTTGGQVLKVELSRN